MTESRHLESVKRIIRSEICTGCSQLPAGETVDPSRPVSCEHECGVFTHLPQLVHIAARRDPMLIQRETATECVHKPVDPEKSPLDCYGDKAVRALTHAGIFHG